jgi:hypothetical protein
MWEAVGKGRVKGEGDGMNRTKEHIYTYENITISPLSN